MDGAKVVTATFAPAPSTLTVTRQGGGGGRVASSPAGIDCGADCSEAYAGGTRVTLTATPASGSVFAGWGGACAAAGASPTCGLTVAQDEVVTARFDRANAGVAVGRLPGIAPSSDPILLATLTARDGCGPFNRIEFGNLGRSFDNARIGILSPPGWPENQTVGFVYTPPPGTTTVSFGFQRIMQHGGATVSPIRLHDGCGVWITLVGGGPDAFR
jgi:hypothetical protein